MVLNWNPHIEMARGGRFAQVDPFGSRSGINLYTYVRNDPLNLLNPQGLSPDGPLSTALASVLALPGTIAAAGGAVGAGVLSATAAIAGAALLAATTSTADRSLDEVQYVVRGGLSAPNTLQTGTNELGPLGLPNQHGISSSSAPGMSVNQIATVADYPHPQLTYTTTGELAGLGYQIQPTPTLNNPLHASILLPPGVSSLTNEQAAALSTIFAPNRVPNPTYLPP